MSAECPGYYTIEKGGFFFQNYEIDSEALWELGGRYLFSAAYIQNAEEQGAPFRMVRNDYEMTAPKIEEEQGGQNE